MQIEMSSLLFDNIKWCIPKQKAQKVKEQDFWLENWVIKVRNAQLAILNPKYFKRSNYFFSG